LQWWLRKRINGPFKSVGDRLDHGRQDDTSNCGIVCANTAACNIFEDDDLWTTEAKALERGWWFVVLVKKHIDDVSFSSSP
jgi:hypothetical protein